MEVFWDMRMLTSNEYASAVYHLSSTIKSERQITYVPYKMKQWQGVNYGDLIEYLIHQ